MHYSAFKIHHTRRSSLAISVANSTIQTDGLHQPEILLVIVCIFANSYIPLSKFLPLIKGKY